MVEPQHLEGQRDSERAHGKLLPQDWVGGEADYPERPYSPPEPELALSTERKQYHPKKQE